MYSGISLVTQTATCSLTRGRAAATSGDPGSAAAAVSARLHRLPRFPMTGIKTDVWPESPPDGSTG